MALVTDHWQLTVKLMDNGRKPFLKPYELRGADYAAATANAAALLSSLSGVTDLEITGYSISEIFVEDAVVVPTLLNAQGEMQARVVLQLDTSPLKKWTHDIPGPKDTLFQDVVGTTGYDIVSTTDAFVVAYFEEFESTGSVFASDGEDVDATNGIIEGARVHRKSGLKSPG